MSTRTSSSDEYLDGWFIINCCLFCVLMLTSTLIRASKIVKVILTMGALSLIPIQPQKAQWELQCDPAFSTKLHNELYRKWRQLLRQNSNYNSECLPMTPNVPWHYWIRNNGSYYITNKQYWTTFWENEILCCQYIHKILWLINASSSIHQL